MMRRTAVTTLAALASFLPAVAFTVVPRPSSPVMLSPASSLRNRQTLHVLHLAESSLTTTTTTTTKDIAPIDDDAAVTGVPKPPDLLEKIRSFYQDVRYMDRNELINNAIVAAVVAVVLVKLTTINAGMMRGWTAEEIVGRIPVDNWRSYSEVLDQAPVATKAATSASVYALGDLIAQRTAGTTMGELDRGRIVRSTLAGLIGHGPMSHVWYNWCDSFFDETLKWTEWWAFFPKVVLDQATWGPFWNNMYIFLLGAMKLESWETMWGDMKRTTIPLVVSGLKLWPLAHCVTYGLVPVENRLLWVDIVEIVWVTILATQAAGGGETEEKTSEVGTDAETAVAINGDSVAVADPALMKEEEAVLR